MIRKKDKAFITTRMEIFMRGSGKREIRMDLEYLNMLMGMFILGNGRLEIRKEMAFLLIAMVKNMKGYGEMIKFGLTMILTLSEIRMKIRKVKLINHT